MLQLQPNQQMPVGPVAYCYGDMNVKQEIQDFAIEQQYASVPNVTPQRMSLWAQVRELEGESLRQIQSLYGNNFPIEFRHYFADVIEAQSWDQIDPNNPNDEANAKNILDLLLNAIEEQCQYLTEGNDFLQRLHFSEIASHFKNVYGQNPLEFVRVVKKILSIEYQLVQHANSGLDDESNALCHQLSEKFSKITRELERLLTMTRNNEADLRTLQSNQEYFVINYQESIKIQANLHQIHQLSNSDPATMQLTQQLTQQQEKVDKVLQAEAQKLQQLRTVLIQRYQKTFALLNQVQNQIVDEELLSWKRSQALSFNGVQHDSNLDQLQQWCEQLADIIWKNRQQVKRIEIQQQHLPINNSGNDVLPELNATITSLLTALVTNTFIIEKQPPQVLKTQTKFGATIRLLVGGKLNVHMSPPVVKASIISESQAKALLKNDASRSVAETSGEILNPENVMEYHPQSGVLSVNFRNMSLRRIRRSDKRGVESVTEEKFTILFQSRFSLGGNELVFQVRTLSMPVVVIVHGNQEANATASILWDNAFAEQGRIPFQVPDKVPWCKLIEALDYKWKQECSSSRGLTAQAKQYLAYKVFGQNVPSNSDKQISWAQFNREPLPNRNFTFWQWFNGVMELTKSKHLQQHWNEGAIIGFIGKAKSQEKLLSKRTGTFLLRFSDSEIAALALAWVAEAEAGKSLPKVWNLQPHTLRDYGIRSLPDRMKDLSHLLYICKIDDRTLAKDEVFERYYSKPISGSALGDGYIPTEIRQTINIPTTSNAGNFIFHSTSPTTPCPNFVPLISTQSPTSMPSPDEIQYGLSVVNQDVNNYHGSNEMAGRMEYDGNNMNSLQSLDIDVNELLGRQI